MHFLLLFDEAPTTVIDVFEIKSKIVREKADSAIALNIPCTDTWIR